MLVLRKELDETWLQVVTRCAGYYGLEREVLALFDSDMKDGVQESQAAWNALYEFDLLDFIKD